MLGTCQCRQIGTRLWASLHLHQIHRMELLNQRVRKNLLQHPARRLLACIRLISQGSAQLTAASGPAAELSQIWAAWPDTSRQRKRNTRSRSKHCSDGVPQTADLQLSHGLGWRLVNLAIARLPQSSTFIALLWLQLQVEPGQVLSSFQVELCHVHGRGQHSMHAEAG